MIQDALPLTVLFDALTLAADKHQYQRRSGYDRLPYINHLLKVGDALIRIGRERDPDLLLAALLHDIIEDTDVTEEELAARFNPHTARIVAELTDDMSLPYAIRKQRQVEGAARLSAEARKIRIADKASNIRDILDYPVDWPVEKKQHYVTNAVEVVNQIRGAQAALEAWFDEVVTEAKEKLDIGG
jgi:guanosine-3',5'-bis(diphosphate) 3'-pyrophosphohydrolase